MKKSLPIRTNPGNGFTVVRVHYSLDPAKDEAWAKIARKPMTERAWKREYEIDYTYFAGKPFYPEFKEHHIAPEQVFPLPGQTIYRGWDFGFHRPACVLTILNSFDQWILLETIIGKDEGIRDFGSRIRNHCLSTYPGCKYIDAADPAGNQSTDKNEATSMQILNALGIFPQSRRQPISLGAEIIRQKLALRVDGKPGLLVNPTNTYMIDGFRGGIHYPEVKEGQQEKEEYEKDPYFAHGFDALRYIATEMFTIIGESQQTNQLGVTDDRDRYRMGRVESNQSDNMHSVYDPFAEPTEWNF